MFFQKEKHISKLHKKIISLDSFDYLKEISKIIKIFICYSNSL